MLRVPGPTEDYGGLGISNASFGARTIDRSLSPAAIDRPSEEADEQHDGDDHCAYVERHHH
jgi:hypothetical protein